MTLIGVISMSYLRREGSHKLSKVNEQYQILEVKAPPSYLRSEGSHKLSNAWPESSFTRGFESLGGLQRLPFTGKTELVACHLSSSIYSHPRRTIKSSVPVGNHALVRTSHCLRHSRSQLKRVSVNNPKHSLQSDRAMKSSHTCIGSLVMYCLIWLLLLLYK